jgi:hypothetical protein
MRAFSVQIKRDRVINMELLLRELKLQLFLIVMENKKLQAWEMAIREVFRMFRL